MQIFSCPICENKIELSDETKPGDRVTCPSCFAQLALYKHNKELVLACPVCKETVFDPNLCDACERRVEKKLLLEEGRL